MSRARRRYVRSSNSRHTRVSKGRLCQPELSREVWNPSGFHHQQLSGGHTGGATPDPIPNSEVKPSRADGTAGGTLWESRSSPGNISAGRNPKGFSRPFSF